jgi:predicted metal-dependent hydrolase
MMRDAAALHPDLTPEERRRLLIEGVDHFNAGRFFDAHEVWEEVWRSQTPEPKPLLQGLIQIAVAMVHHRDRGRPAVARRVLAKGWRRVEPYLPSALGIDLESLRRSVESWSVWLGETAENPGVSAPPDLPRLLVPRPSELR